MNSCQQNDDGHAYNLHFHKFNEENLKLKMKKKLRYREIFYFTFFLQNLTYESNESR